MPPRKKLKRSAANPKEQSHRPTLDAPTVATPNNSERSKGGRRRPKKSLEFLPEMPVEILLEVFSQLHPRDLLSLVRTCKKFRAFLLNRNSGTIWNSSLGQIEDLPECPPFLSEPVYAYLLFSQFCQQCGASNVHNALWGWFARYCGKCAMNKAVRKTYVSGYIPRGLEENPSKLFGVCFLQHAPAYYRPEAVEFHDAWYSADGNPDLQNEIVKRQREKAEQRMAYASRCQDWCERQQEDRQSELVDLRQQRMLNIIERLKAAGWEEEMEYFDENDMYFRFQRIPSVIRATKLTDRGWPKVYAALQETLNALRKSRLAMQRQDVIMSRLKDLSDALFSHYIQLPRSPRMDCRPVYDNIMYEKEFAELLVAPNSRNVTRDDFANVAATVCTRWEEQCVETLRAIVRSAVPTIPDGVDPLKLAIAAFPLRCNTTDCAQSGPHRYPAVLAHICSTDRYRGKRWARDDGNGKEDFLLFAARRLMRGTTPSYYDKETMVVGQTAVFPRYAKGDILQMRYIVAALGLDPERATYEDLEKNNGRLQCKVCFPKAREVFSWQAAFSHSHRGCAVERDFWVRMNDEELATVLQIEAKEATKSQDNALWSCSLCPAWNGYRNDMKIHLKSDHDIGDFEKSIDDGTIFLYIDQCTARKGPVIYT